MLLDNVAELTEENASTIAQQFRNVTGADIALAVLGTTGSAQDMYSEDTGRSVIAVATAQGASQRAHSVGGISEQAQMWVTTRALDLVRRAVLKT
jgi:nicotinamide mononucleotide (NMN) deamidase PncC